MYVYACAGFDCVRICTFIYTVGSSSKSSKPHMRRSSQSGVSATIAYPPSRMYTECMHL